MTPPLSVYGAGKPGLDFGRVSSSIQFRFNPVRYATADRLGSELDAFYTGILTIARFWDMMQMRDPDIRVACNKRCESVENLEWEICYNEDAYDEEDAASVALADEQKSVLQAFYSSLKVTEILKQDASGGVGMLARQMLDARAKGWAVHEIIWNPDVVNGTLTAELRFCPLYWFENKHGRLRFLTDDYQVNGIEMRPNEWLVTTSDNFMESATTLWLCKRELIQAWVRFCLKYGMPLPIIKSESSKGSAEWNAALDALDAITEDWAAVLSNSASLEFGQVDRSGDSTFQALHEELKRTLVTLILGSDLATISAGSGQGQGASLQGREDQKREKADASLISETLNRTLDRHVIDYVFGPDVPALVRFVLVPSKQQDIAAELNIDKFLLDNGVELSKSDLRGRYGRSEPAVGSELAGQAQQTAPATMQPDVNPDDTNPALSNDLKSAAMAQIAKARAQDLESVARELSLVMRAEDPQTMIKLLKAYQVNAAERAKRIVSNPDNLAPAIEKLLATATLDGISSSKSV